MNSSEVKAALYRRHPATSQYTLAGPWTCVEEWHNVDFLAFAAWTKPPPARSRYARVGYEVKVSRGDMRAELLSPYKRAAAVAFCHEFYFAVPKGLLRPDEKAFEEPALFSDPASFTRDDCPGRCYRDRHGKLSGHFGSDGFVPCAACEGKGYAQASLVEREAPTLWVPSDVGLVEVDAGGTARMVKQAPKRDPRGLTDSMLTDLVRWVSIRPDPRHRQPPERATA